MRLSANSLAAYRTDLRLVLRTLAVVTTSGLDESDVVAVDDVAGALTIEVLTIDHLAGAFARVRTGDFRGKSVGPRSDASVRRIWASVNAFCARLVDRRLLPGDPMAGIDNAALPEIQPKALSTAETEVLIAAARAAPPPGVRTRWLARDTSLVLTGLLAGLRASEITGVQIGDLRQSADGLYLRVRG